MIYRPLGQTDIEVSALCLGTMTYGEQNSETEAHKQLDQAFDAGINLIDTAEMYPVPPRAETQGLTERHIGTWLANRGRRDRVILATKVAGPGEWLNYIRDGNLHLDKSNIETALEQSLQRLQTDYIDIYQLHWPDRHTNYFGELGYRPDEEEQTTPILETLQVLSDLIKAGKIRHIGVSNETPWGLMRYLQLAEELDLPRVVSIQNPYNLLNRTFEIGLAEIAHREACGLLAYSPMAFGVLSGKYLDGQQPSGARLTLFERFNRYSNPETDRATERYVALAREQDLNPAQMALAFVTSRPFVTSNIIGATTLAQLDQNIDSIHMTLSDETLQGIEAIHRQQPNPSP
ncbi:MAG: NADP(H)-dependent aldo-keto reductase [Candidatus Thiodiazotropha sp. (ex Lucinoma annulata)]|nr:NADP(H)-dependent aldo-keto reductase [Candidatus Thiodiazotropha sp. (ex Lucinoma borealis)]MCU7839345.1 NADP(H)-dependent aldo-keto reductase [Candidatus Thiodiazotropha sp. (ex Troendleina suluensis)]MCU7883854.1 NADP(H)-dependent aldo-keto reductase [Candidatus Thiodiazotropha sp. (ex Lucinoma annulata)]MCU7947556.1 NADP(H)-dependent aldo-keto reductase [Candidatus Thiodiazotropha sp. (ex Cardiolucina cf. quadrata)]MCU7863379.1 NADP(H)-dependent aldo-keto reductase [Candidatus Thiodiazot